MNIFYDLEFTGLHQKTTIISIGLISEQGHVFYAEFDDFDLSQCNEFIQKEVIGNLLNPKFGNGTMDEVAAQMQESLGNATFIFGSTEEIKNALLNWLNQFNYIEWIGDVCHYDFVLLIDLLYGNALDIPPNVGKACFDINQMIAEYKNMPVSKAFDLSREQLNDDSILYSYIPDNLAKHNSLKDAFIIRALYRGFYGIDKCYIR